MTQSKDRTSIFEQEGDVIKWGMGVEEGRYIMKGEVSDIFVKGQVAPVNQFDFLWWNHKFSWSELWTLPK